MAELLVVLIIVLVVILTVAQKSAYSPGAHKTSKMGILAKTYCGIKFVHEQPFHILKLCLVSKFYYVLPLLCFFTLCNYIVIAISN